MMTFADFQDLIVPTTTIACLCVGFVLNNLVPGEKLTKFIPLIMGVLGIAFTAWTLDWAMDPNIFLTGFVSGLASTGMYEMFKNFITNPKPVVDTVLDAPEHFSED